MATVTPSPPRQHLSTSNPGPHHRSLLVLWHLLSLDAPTVAALWTWFIARANHIRLPIAATAAMAIAVWMLYAADRLLDAQSTQHDTLEARHLFHHRHYQAFLIGVFAAAAALAFLLPRLDAQSVHLYLILGGLVFGYFILIHVTRSVHRLPKEIAVGIFFAAATFIPTVARQPHLRLTLLAPAFLFAMLCSLNCLLIYAWEHAPSHREHAVHPTTRLALHHLNLIANSIVVAGIALAFLDRSAPWPILVAITAAAMLLLTLHHQKNHIQSTTLRAAADLVLLTPLLLLPFLK